MIALAENLKRQRELAACIRDLNGSLEVRETGKPTRAIWHYAPELAELVLAAGTEDPFVAPDVWDAAYGSSEKVTYLAHVHVSVPASIAPEQRDKYVLNVLTRPDVELVATEEASA